MIKIDGKSVIDMKYSQFEKPFVQNETSTRYFKPQSTRLHTTSTLYEELKGGKEGDTFRRKRQSDCYELNYSSHLNPFARSGQPRFDLPKK